MPFGAKLGFKQKFQLICNTECLMFEHKLELSTRKSERTAAQVPDDDALFGCLDWRQVALVSRSWTSQVRVYQLPVGIDDLASLAL